MSQTTEEWRPVPGYEGHYEISSHGRVMSLKRGQQRLIRFTPDKDGYPKFRLYKDGQERRGTVHILVALVFHGPRPDGLQVRHLDGDRTNARADNLAHGSHHWARKTHCPANHEYTEENTAYRGGRRHCRACQRARYRRRTAA
jgi:hypothetical protein